MFTTEIVLIVQAAWMVYDPLALAGGSSCVDFNQISSVVTFKLHLVVRL